jgi:hypothetical protein
MKDRSYARKTNHFAILVFRFETKGLGFTDPKPGKFYKKPLWEIAKSMKLSDKFVKSSGEGNANELAATHYVLDGRR